MNTTRELLLRRVRDASDADAWEEFYSLYAPLLFRYARERGLLHADAQEVRDRCLEIVTRRLPDFEYDPARGRFRAWLRRIARDVVTDLVRRRRPDRLETADGTALADPGDGPDRAWERAWLHEHLMSCLEEAAGEVPRRSYQAFCMLLASASVPEVCEALELNANQVYKAKRRVLERIRGQLEKRGITPDGVDRGE